MVLGYDYPILGFFFSVLMIALFVIWLWLLFSVLIDVFRSEDLNGWTKALWVIFVVLRGPQASSLAFWVSNSSGLITPVSRRPASFCSSSAVLPVLAVCRT